MPRQKRGSCSGEEKRLWRRCWYRQETKSQCTKPSPERRERKEEMEAISRRGRARQKKGDVRTFPPPLCSSPTYSRETQDHHESPKKKGTFLLSEALAGKKEYRVRKPNLYPQQPRVRQFCVDIAHSFIRRNIDAELLREHCVRRICAHYNFCNFCAISPFASTLASQLRKKKIKKFACAKK